MAGAVDDDLVVHVGAAAGVVGDDRHNLADLWARPAGADVDVAVLLRERVDARLRILDDQPVADQDAPNASDDPIKIFEGFVAPGRHKISLRVECGATGDANQSYSAESSFIVEAVDGKQARVKWSVDETGDGPQSLAKKKEGTFDVRLRGDVAMLKLDEK